MCISNKMRITDYFKNSISVDLLSTKSLKYNGVRNLDAKIRGAFKGQSNVEGRAFSDNS